MNMEVDDSVNTSVPIQYWRIRYEVHRTDGTVFKAYTPLYYISWEECNELVRHLNQEHNGETPVHHYAELFTVQG